MVNIQIRGNLIHLELKTIPESKDFSSIKADLIEYTKSYFPDTYKDFNETSPGMMFIEQAAYVGDVLSFYLDNQIQENFIQYARQIVIELMFF